MIIIHNQTLEKKSHFIHQYYLILLAKTAFHTSTLLLSDWLIYVARCKITVYEHFRHLSLSPMLFGIHYMKALPRTGVSTYPIERSVSLIQALSHRYITPQIGHSDPDHCPYSATEILNPPWSIKFQNIYINNYLLCIYFIYIQIYLIQH